MQTAVGQGWGRGGILVLYKELREKSPLPSFLPSPFLLPQEWNDLTGPLLVSWRWGSMPSSLSGGVMFPKEERLSKGNVTDVPSVWEGQGKHKEGGTDLFGSMNAKTKDILGRSHNTENVGKCDPVYRSQLVCRWGRAEGKEAKRQVRARSWKVLKTKPRRFWHPPSADFSDWYWPSCRKALALLNLPYPMRKMAEWGPVGPLTIETNAEWCVWLWAFFDGSLCVLSEKILVRWENKQLEITFFFIFF